MAAPEVICHPAGPDQAPPALPPSLPAGHRDALAQLCDELDRLLAGRPELRAGTGNTVQVQLLDVTDSSFTLRLLLHRAGEEVAGPPLSLTATDDGPFSATALRLLAGHLIAAGPLAPTP